ncbi:hypothetical protein QQP08_009599 [Theobroma cacao]|nr:hypothetical protein QQP08_009599 [Theobroma cacao]
MNRAPRSTSRLYISLLLSNLSINSNEENVLVFVECSNLVIQFIWKGKELNIRYIALPIRTSPLVLIELTFLHRFRRR